MQCSRLDENRVDKLKAICKQINYQSDEILNVIQAALELFGFVSDDIQQIIAQEMGVSIARVNGIVMFNSFPTNLPLGKISISVCMGSSCYARGSELVLQAFREKLAINVGEITVDGRFSLKSHHCLGACGFSPIVTVGDKIFSRVSVDEVTKIINT